MRWVLIHLAAAFLAAAVSTAAAPAPPPQRAPAAARSKPPAVCQLQIEGFGSRPGIKAARLACNRGSVKAAAHPELRKHLGKATPGVAWASTEGRKVNGALRCLLYITGGSEAEFVRPRVTGVIAASHPALDDLWDLVCINERSHLTFSGGAFAGCDRHILDVAGDATAVHLHASTFANISVNAQGRWGAALTVYDTAEVSIQGCRFDGNVAARGGAIWATNDAVVRVLAPDEQHSGPEWSAGQADLQGQPTVFINNLARAVDASTAQGGAIYANERARVVVSGARFLANRAVQGSGGSISLANTSSLTLLRSTIQGCQVSRDGGGGGIAAAGKAVVRINSSTLTGNTAGYGGGLQLLGNATASMHDTRITNSSSSQGGGGAIYVTEGAHLQAAACTVAGCRAANYGGAILVGDQGRAVLTGTRLVGNTAKEAGGGAYLMDQASLVLRGGAIANSTATGGGGGAYGEGASTLTLVGVSIMGCAAKAGGGGVYVKDSAVANLTNCTLADNTAGGQEVQKAGGGLFAEGNATLDLADVVITGNRATWGGGIYAQQDATLQLRSAGPPTRVVGNQAWRFGGGLLLGSPNFDPEALPNGSAPLLAAANNKLPFGGDVAFETRDMAFLGSSSDLDAFIPSTSLRSGLHVALNVSGPQGMPATETLTVMLSGGPSNVSAKLESVQASSTQPITEATVQLGSSPGPGNYTLTFSVEVDGAHAIEPVRVPFKIVPCPRGHVTVERRCRPCERGLFSFDPSAQDCQACPADAVCPGGARLWPAREFWHSAPQSTQMHRCFNPAACIGGAAASARNGTQPLMATGAASQAYKTAQCSAPYQGNLCGSCKPGFGKLRAFTCRQCMPPGGIVAVYVIAVVAVTCLIRLLTFLQALSSSKGASQPSSGGGGPGGSVQQQPAPFELLKVLVLHSQWLFIMSSLVGIPWPPTLLWPMHALGGLWSGASGSSIGMECILPHNAVPVAVQKLLLCLFTPVAIMGAVLMFEAVMHCVRPRRAAGAKHAFVGLAICIVFVFLPTWVHTALSLFTCVTLDKPAAPPYQAAAIGTWWVEDMSQQCYSSAPGMYHKAWALGLGVPLVVVLCLCLPAGVFAFMWLSRRQGRLKDTSFRQHYGFMFRTWRREVCWWEAVVVLQTIALVMVATFGFALGPFFQSLVAAAVLAVVALLLAVVRPFECPGANTISMQSVSVLLFTAYAALTFLPYNGLAAGPVYGAIMGVVVLVANLAFLVATAWRLGRAAIATMNLAPVGRWLSRVTGGRCGACCAGGGSGGSCWPAGCEACRELPGGCGPCVGRHGPPGGKGATSCPTSGAKLGLKDAGQCKGPPERHRY